jgi:hypothetical protein
MRNWKFIFLAVCVTAILVAIGCGGGSGAQKSAISTGTVNVSISDPPTCAGPSGAFDHVYVTIASVKIHTSSTASDTDPGWADLAPALKTAPMQVDLLGIANNQCFLAMLGSTVELQQGSYQQIRIFLADDAVAGTVAGNKCGTGANCVVLHADGSTHPLDLSSESKTGIKIPSGQLAGGKFTIAAGETKDLNIDFDACASIIAQTGGRFRLKPVMHAGEVKLTASSVNGKLIDKETGAAIVGGKAVVALEQKDANGVDRVIMQTTTDAAGGFVLCPVPAGTYDVVVVAVSGTGVAYAATITSGVQPGNALGNIPMIAQTGTTTTQASITGQITTTSGAATSADITLSALQSATIGGSAVNVTIPLAQQSSATASVSTASGSCPAGTNCVTYTIAVPAMQPNIGAFVAGATAYTQSTTTPVNYSVEGQAFVPGSGATQDCVPPIMTVNTITGGGALSVTPGVTANAAVMAFVGCQ